MRCYCSQTQSMASVGSEAPQMFTTLRWYKVCLSSALSSISALLLVIDAMPCHLLCLTSESDA